MSKNLIIAIDGPSGAGKSTLGRLLARELNLLYIDTGSMYRAVALAVIESSVSAHDDVAVGSLAGHDQRSDRPESNRHRCEHERGDERLDMAVEQPQPDRESVDDDDQADDRPGQPVTTKSHSGASLSSRPFRQRYGTRSGILAP